ncbi:MAG: RNA methyltransferase [Actinomycetota bacterium]
MITSPHNEKLKLVRRLRERRGRERDGLFLTEGEDMLEAGLASGAEPRLLLSAAGSGIGGLEVEPQLLARFSALGSGTRVIAAWELRWATQIEGPVCVYLHGVGDPANVGSVIRSAHALVAGTVVLGPGCADPFSPKAVRASMGSAFGQPLARGTVADTPRPRLALLAHGGEVAASAWPPTPLTVCLGAERDGLPPEVLEACQRTVTFPLRAGAESLNVAAAAAIVLQGISSRPSRGRGAATSEGERNG